LRLCRDQPRLRCCQLALLVADDGALPEVQASEEESGGDRRDAADRQDAPRRQLGAGGRPPTSGLCVLREKVDGLHQRSTPSPIATASDAMSSRWPTEPLASTAASGSATRTRALVRRSSSSTRPGS